MVNLLIPRRVTTSDLYLNLWVYGDPGVGKTTFAAGALDHPKLGPALFINIEGGLLSVAGRGDIDAVEISHPDDIDRITYAILTGDPNFSKYKCIIVDSLTELQSISLSTIVGEAMRKNPGKDRSVDDIEIGDYGKSSTQMKRLIGALRNAKIHVIFTGLAKREYPKGADPRVSQPTAVGPSLTSKLADHAMGMMDFVWFMYKDPEGQRTILTQEFNQFKAKTRGPAFAEAMGLVHVNPHLPTLYDLLVQTESTNNINHAPPSNMQAMNPTMGPQVEAVMPVTEIPVTSAEELPADQPEQFPVNANGSPNFGGEAPQPEQVEEPVFSTPGTGNSPVGSPFALASASVSSTPIPSGS